MFLVPWNGPTYQGAGASARVKANLLPGCQWRMFDTTGFAAAGSASQDGSTNEIGVRGALHVTQNQPMYYLNTYSNAGDVTGQIPQSRELPTYTFHGRDTTEWQCFLGQFRMIKGDPAIGTYFMYTYKIFFTFSGVRLSQAADLNPHQSLGNHYSRQPDAFNTYEDPAEQERANPVLCDFLRRKNARWGKSLACVCQAKAQPEEELVRDTKWMCMDQTSPERPPGPNTERQRVEVRQVSPQGGELLWKPMDPSWRRQEELITLLIFQA